MCIDYLAKLETRFTSDLLILLGPLAELCSLLMTNIMDVAYHRIH